jgi:hypothetical protein
MRSVIVTVASERPRPDSGNVAARGRPGNPGGVTETSDRAELSTLRSQLEDLTARVTTVAERYGGTPDSAVAADLFAAERSLTAARRSLDKVIAAMRE